jgi:hypothetical protein
METAASFEAIRAMVLPGKDTPAGRVAASVSPGGNKIISWPRLGGLHRRYTVAG